jgi:hypothetical protein
MIRITDKIKIKARVIWIKGYGGTRAEVSEPRSMLSPMLDSSVDRNQGNRTGTRVSIEAQISASISFVSLCDMLFVCKC